MSKRRSSLASTVSALAFDSPFVIARRMALLGEPAAYFPGKGQAEFTRMIFEKQMAAAEAWMAMLGNTARVCQAMWWPWVAGGAPSGMPTAGRTAQAANRVLRPYQRRASANARRLRKRG